MDARTKKVFHKRRLPKVNRLFRKDILVNKKQSKIALSVDRLFFLFLSPLNRSCLAVALAAMQPRRSRPARRVGLSPEFLKLRMSVNPAPNGTGRSRTNFVF